MTDVLFKPTTTGVGAGNASVLVQGNATTVEIVDADGNVIDTLQRSPFDDPSNPGRGKWLGSRPGRDYGKGVRVRVDGKEYNVNDSANRYEFSAGNPEGKESPDTVGGGNPNVPNFLNPFQFGAGFSPPFLGGFYPQFQNVQFPTINTPDYNLVDPQEFGKKYGEFTRNEITKNFALGKQLGLEQLQTELQGLKSYVPAAAALKREQTALDNLFNQAQRTTQLDRATPGVRRNLQGQTERAATYAEGRLTGDVEDRALELGMRSRSADISRSRGFGDDSTVAAKSSDLMSAEQRFQIAQYGEQLVGQNAQVRSQVELAPTEYSQAGQQVQVMPSQSAGLASQQYTSQANQLATIPASQAFTSEIGQQQFLRNTRLAQDTFNAQGLFNAQTFNSSNQFAAQLGLFNYLTSFANNLAGLGTSQINQAREDAIREQLTEVFKDQLSRVQNRELIKDIIQGIGSVPGFIDAAQELAQFFGVNLELDPNDEDTFEDDGNDNFDDDDDEEIETRPTADNPRQEESGEEPPITERDIPPDEPPITERDIPPDEPVERSFVRKSSGSRVIFDRFGVTRNGYNLGVDLEQFERDLTR